MAEPIKDGTGQGYYAKVTKDHRVLNESINELISSERSRVGKLWGTGTGSVSVNSAMNLASMLWLRNDYSNQDLYIQKLIFGWNGGEPSRNKTIFSLIFYNTDEPGANRASASAQLENISKSGQSAAVTDENVTAWKWDGTGTVGMTDTGGGFAQIPNRLSIGNSSIPIDGEIILGPGNSMEFRIIPDEDGAFNVAAVYYTAPHELGRAYE